MPAFAAIADKSPATAVVNQIAVSKLSVVTTIRPVHSLLSFIMQGSATPVLLLDSNQSIHHYSLRPSQRRSLAHADIVFWLGETLESFMPRVLNAIPESVQVVELLKTKNLTLLETRSHPDSIHQHQTQHHNGNIDPHIWLSIDNALIIASKMADTLSTSDPAHETLYQTNLKNLSHQLIAQQNKIRLWFKQADFKYLVYHDAFQYFEQQINISPLAAVSTDEERAPGIRHLSEVIRLIEKNKVECFIYNSPTLPPVADNLNKNHNMKMIYLDPLGQDLEPGPELYFKLLNSLANGYLLCQKTN